MNCARDFASTQAPSGVAHAKSGDVDRAEGLGAQVPRPGQLPLTEPGGVMVPPRVPVEVELQLGGRAAGDIAPANGGAAGQRARRVVQPHIDVVVGVARGPGGLLLPDQAGAREKGGERGQRRYGGAHGVRAGSYKRCARGGPSMAHPFARLGDLRARHPAHAARMIVWRRTTGASVGRPRHRRGQATPAAPAPARVPLRPALRRRTPSGSRAT